MKLRKKFVGTLVVVVMLALVANMTLAQGMSPQALLGTAFTYQGRLTNAGGPVTGTCDFTFDLYDVAGSGSPPTGGSLLGTDSKPGVEVSEGLFTVQLDFGAGAFYGKARWLQVTLACGNGVVTLSPRQELTPAPYALALPGLWTQQNDTSPNLIGGHDGNGVADGAVGATIGGGGSGQKLCGTGGAEPCTHYVADDYGTVGGGWYNQAGDGARTTTDEAYATVGGGYYNTASGLAATVGGGGSNTARSHGTTVGGGAGSTASGNFATVGGGVGNTAGDIYATVGGGGDNTASGLAATVGGGAGNIAEGVDATVGGGHSNFALGAFATIPGGVSNLAQGDYSFAAGRRARAFNRGCFVLADATDAYEDCINDNRFVFRVTNAFYIWTKADHTAGVLLPTGGNAWTSLSDRNVKANFAALDGREVLARLAEVPIQTWNYKSQDPSIRHMGPMAQDFYAAFGLGEDDKHISTVDADGVALAAIQGLYQLVQERDSQIATQQGQIDDLQARLAALETLVDTLAQDSAGGGQ